MIKKDGKENMKIKRLMITLCSLCVICMGCSFGNTKQEVDQKGKNIIRELNQEQEELLCAISVNKDKVKNGKLYDWQVEVLNQFDYAMEYLAAKYPSYSFKMVYCIPKNKMNSYTTFSFIEQADSNKCYDLYLYVDDKGAYEAEDNFYGDIKEDELAVALLTLLQDEFPECVQVTTNIPYVQGQEYDEELNINQIINGEIKLSQNSTIYIQSEILTEEKYQEKVKKLNDFLINKEIEGSYTVVFMERVNKSELYKDNFGV